MTDWPDCSLLTLLTYGTSANIPEYVTVHTFPCKMCLQGGAHPVDSRVKQTFVVPPHEWFPQLTGDEDTVIQKNTVPHGSILVLQLTYSSLFFCCNFATFGTFHFSKSFVFFSDNRYSKLINFFCVII